MKRIIVAVLLLLLLFSAQVFAAGADGRVWSTTGLKTGSVAANVELANTGVMPSAEYSILVVVSSLTAATVDFEAWNSDMTIKIKSQRIHLLARGFINTRLTLEYPIAQDVIMILKNITALTSAEIQGSIFVE
jgi:hypothetical protein